DAGHRVHRVGPDRDVDRDRRPGLGGAVDERAVAGGIRPARELLREGAAEALLALRAFLADAVEGDARLADHAEAAVLDRLGDLLRGLSHERDLEVVDRRGAVQRESRHDAALGEIGEDRPEPRLDHVAAEGEDDVTVRRAQGTAPEGSCRIARAGSANSWLGWGVRVASASRRAKSVSAPSSRASTASA